MKAAYLIYYHDLDPYEGQDIPFAIVSSERKAKKIRQNIIHYGDSLAEQMLYPYEDGISDEEYWARDSKNRKLMNAPWPHNWQSHSSSDFERKFSHMEDEPEKMEFQGGTVEYRELPLL